MREGIHADTPEDKLQNKLKGVGSLMVRNKFAKDARLSVAKHIYKALILFPAIDRRMVFSAFFTKGELSDDPVIQVALIAPKP